MSEKKKKRVTLVEKESKKAEPYVKQLFYKKAGKTYEAYLVQGWREEGKWKRKQFKTLDEAEDFKLVKALEIKGHMDEKQSRLTILSQKQLQQAEDVFQKIGETYSMPDLLEFFLKHHRAPEYTITLEDAFKPYLDDCERDGLRARTRTEKGYILKAFAESIPNTDTHTVTPQHVERFLRGLTGRKEGEIASRKTWNNYRNVLSHFFKWASTEDVVTHRPFTFINPVDDIRVYSNKLVEEQRKEIVITEADEVLERMTYLMNFKEGKLCKFYALVYFAGIRPDHANGEIFKLAQREKELINLKTRTIHIPANVSKIRRKRQVKISENLAQWLEAYEDYPILPTNFSKTNAAFRKHFGFTRDETRHSFISFHVAVHRSLGDVALQAGNSESVVNQHYLNLRPAEDGDKFFSICPSVENSQAVLTSFPKEESKLRVV